MPLVAAAAALLLLLAACSAGNDPSAAASVAESTAESMAPSAAASMDEEPAGATVTITNTSFNTEELTVAPGDAITFVNDSNLPHTVTEGQDGNATDGARFDEQVNAGESVEIVFEEAGDYDVTCLFHSNMNMVVHVE